MKNLVNQIDKLKDEERKSKIKKKDNGREFHKA